MKYTTLLRELKALFSLGEKTSFLYFLSELVTFLVIAAFSAFLVSFPIFYIGTNYTKSYKLLGSFLIVFLLFVLFMWRVVSAFKEQQRGREGGGSFEDNIRSAIYSFSYIFPAWFLSLSVFILSFIFVSLIVIVFFRFSLYLWLSSIGLYRSLLEPIVLWIGKVLGVLVLFGSDYFLGLFLLFFVLLSIIVLFSSKSIIEKYSSRFLIWTLFILELVILLSICYIFISLMFHTVL